jgi:putative CocE/NonD family hydrolase
MVMTPYVILALCASIVLVLYGYRRQLTARLMGLSSPLCGVRVTRDVPVTMPDGIRILADHYAPRAAGPFPTILIRTPYGRGGDGGPKGMGPLAERFAERGYHVVVQDVRGRFKSEGEFDPYANDAADGRATLDWIAHQPWFNGALGMWGVSYMGYVQWAVAADAPPFLKALVPGLISPERFTAVFPDGAFALDGRLNWIRTLTLQDRWSGLPWWRKLAQMAAMVAGGSAPELEAAFMHLPLIEADVVATGEVVPIYREMVLHEREDHPHWQARDHRAALPGLGRPVHLIGGWYDLYLRGILDSYAALKAGAGGASPGPYLTVGPWCHADPGMGVEAIREGLAWFEAHLKGEREQLRNKPVRICVMGIDEWREMDDWPPPARQTRYFLQAGAGLATEPPAAAAPPDRYTYDPADPTPAVGGARMDRAESGPLDNRALEARPDVLCYTTGPLADDLTVVGPVRLALFVRSSLAHTDFFGRLCDVAPDGRSINVCDGLVRVAPGEGEPGPGGSLGVEVDMWATAYCFRRGHRVRLQVSSGAHPRWSRNLGTGEPMATGTAMQVARQTIYHDAAHPSALVLPVV